MNKTAEEIKKILTDLLNECLASGNQEHSFTVTGIDLEKMKFSVEFDIVQIPEDGYIGFSGY
jgi:hypothetical protein